MVEGTSSIRTSAAAMMPTKAAALSAMLAGGLTALAVAAALVGPYPITPAELVSAVLRWLSGVPTASQADTVLFEVRLPRVLAALLTGAALSAAGAVFQTLFRNPLVSPDILGVSTGAGLGAVIGIFSSLPVLGIQLFAFGFALATVALV